MTLNISAEIFIPLVVLAVAFGWIIAWRKMRKADQKLQELREKRDRLQAEQQERELRRLFEAARQDPDYSFLHQEFPLSSVRLSEEQRDRARRRGAIQELEQEIFGGNLTEEQRQHARQAALTGRLSRDMGRVSESIDETMRRAFQPFDQAMGNLDREVRRLTGGQQGGSRDGSFTSVTVTTERTTTQAPQAKAKQEEGAKKQEPEAPRPDRFDRILRDD